MKTTHLRLLMTMLVMLSLLIVACEEDSDDESSMDGDEDGDESDDDDDDDDDTDGDNPQEDGDEDGDTIEYDPLSCNDISCYDPNSSLTWQNPPAEETMSWRDADSYCENLTLDGGGWRLPGISELRSLLRGCLATEVGGDCTVEDGVCLSFDSCRNRSCNGCTNRLGPTDDCYWPSEIVGECSRYWSSSPVDGEASYAWFVYFINGLVDGCSTTSGEGVFNVRCVR